MAGLVQMMGEGGGLFTAAYIAFEASEQEGLQGM